MKKCLVALAFGTLGLGMSEFGMMGILTFVASGLHVSIPQAGHLVSAYRWGFASVRRWRSPWRIRGR